MQVVTFTSVRPTMSEFIGHVKSRELLGLLQISTCIN